MALDDPCESQLSTLFLSAFTLTQCKSKRMAGTKLTCSAQSSTSFSQMKSLILFLFALGSGHVLRTNVSAMTMEPVINCNNSSRGFVPEGQSVTCQCLAPVSGPSPSPSLWWPGHSSTASLTVTSVRRDHNGTRYTCLMATEGGNTTATFTLLVAYGPSDTVIDGPAQFVTDGRRTMTLTCVAREVYPAPVYRWPGPLCNSSTNNCTFTPRPEHHGEKILCIAINTEAAFSRTGSYIVALKYPPQKAPLITVNTTNKLLSSGNAVRCTVEGGRPLVTSVNFTCANLILSEKVPIRNSTAVTSVIAIHTTEPRQTSLACSCSATWDLEPNLYTNSSETVFDLEYKDNRSNFTINGAQQLTVIEADQPQASFHCNILARPPANLTLQKQGNDSVFAISEAENTRSVELERTELQYNLSEVRCEDTGIYECAADNGFPHPVSTHASLNVSCAPRSFNTSMKIPTDGELNVVLVANPVPSAFQYFFSSPETGKVRTNSSQVTFQTDCKRHRSLEHLATCTVKAVLVPTQYLGDFTVSFSNGLGEYNYSFKITSPEPPNSVGRSLPLLGPLVIGVIATAGVILIIIIVTVILCVRRAKRKRPSGRTSVTAHPRCESVMFDNVAYESSDAFLNQYQTPLYDLPLVFSEQRHSTVDNMTSNGVYESTKDGSCSQACENIVCGTEGDVAASGNESSHAKSVIVAAERPGANHIYAVVDKAKKN